MKRTLVLVAILSFILSSLAWAEGPAASPANGGRCILPDLARLSPEQAAAAAIQAGFQVSPTSSPTTTVPACPSNFRCSSLPGCVAETACFGFGIGPCCSTGTAVVCCGSNILVVSCPCKCAFEDCPHQCDQSNQLTWSCASSTS